MFSGCSALTIIPQLDTSNVTDMSSMFYSCSALTTIPQLDTSKVTNSYDAFSYCGNLRIIKQIDFARITTASSVFYGCGKLVFVKILNLGKSNLKSHNFSGATNWGTGDEENRQSLIDSLITYSHDRASNGMAAVPIQLSANTKALLTEEEIAQITAKGFTIS
jgi:surface protein